MSRISRQIFVFQEILAFLADEDKVRMQLVSKKFYDKIVPFSLSAVKMNNADHVRPQHQLFQYASGYVMHKSLD